MSVGNRNRTSRPAGEFGFFVKQYGRNARKHPDRTIAATVTTPSA
ncbi:hypothetical protein P355_2411 [Burkholderia cenocepacia KC-01]|nr:hypothetical protein P355_2411 [Burkholderia cenocepacia KC-01]